MDKKSEQWKMIGGNMALVQVCMIVCNLLMNDMFCLKLQCYIDNCKV